MPIRPPAAWFLRNGGKVGRREKWPIPRLRPEYVSGSIPPRCGFFPAFSWSRQLPRRLERAGTCAIGCSDSVADSKLQLPCAAVSAYGNLADGGARVPSMRSRGGRRRRLLSGMQSSADQGGNGRGNAASAPEYSG